MKGSLDDLDFTKISEKFDQERIAESSLLSDDHDDIFHCDDSGGHEDIFHHDGVGGHDDTILPLGG
jgi:hypothetical protein